MNSSVSVVIPAYNEAEYIAACIKSLKAQDFKGEIEIIVVDNASTDGTGDIARREGVAVILEPIRGVCAARQKGTSVARGEIIVSTDADTIFPSDWIQNIVSAFAAHTTVVIVSGPVRFTNDAPYWGVLFTKYLSRYLAWYYKKFGTIWNAHACNLAFRKSAWRGYNTRLHAAGDELALVRDLKKRGGAILLPNNIVTTSARRARAGFFYNVFVTVLWHYFFDYCIGRVTGRSVLGPYPPIRASDGSDR